MRPVQAVVILTSIFFSASLVHAETSLEAAIALYKEKKYAESRAELEKITVTEPQNAEACFYLGLALSRSRDSDQLENAVNWLKKAVELKPQDPAYLLEYGGVSLMYAGKNRSLGAANRGREALEKVIELDPANIEARIALYRYYEQAPWPIGSHAKAMSKLDEIRKINPNRAILAELSFKMEAKDYAASFKICDDVLAREPDNQNILVQYYRIALRSGENIDRAIACLQKCLAAPTPPQVPGGYAAIQCGIGNLLEKKGDIPGARAAYEAALKLNGNFTSARESLDKLK